jgi:Zn-finger nucleic acid-binding protein
MEIEKFSCPECNVELKRDYGISGVVVHCPKCNKNYIKCLGKLMNMEEFHQRVEKEQ